MNITLRILGFVLVAAATAAPSPGQKLRRALAAADAVVVGRQVEAIPRGEQIVLHRITVMDVLRGAAALDQIVVMDYPKLSFHERPVPGELRLYCLHDHGAAATRMGLLVDSGPYFKMSGFPGSHPPIGQDLATDPVLAFARVMARADTGTPPRETAQELYHIALEGDPAVREEAARLLGERELLRAELSPVHWSSLATKAAGIEDDIAYKIALAELCAVQGVDGLVDALVVSLGPVSDPEYARAVGRIARHILGENAIGPLQARLAGTRRPQQRAAILLAMGATDTDAALQALLRMRKLAPEDKAVAAALGEHHSPRAKEALLAK